MSRNLLSTRGPSRTTQVSLTAAVVLVGAVLIWLAARAPYGVPGVPTYNVAAELADLGGLSAGDDVRIGGVRVGRVDDTRLDGGHAEFTLELTGVRSLPAGTRAEVRSRGLLGARFLELTPGSGRTTLPEGATIPLADTSATVDLPTALLAFDAPTRRALSGAFDGLGRGLTGRGLDLNDMLRDLPAEFTQTRRLSTTLLRSGELDTFAQRLDRGLAAIDPVRDELAAGIVLIRATLEPFALASAALGTTLDLAPGALRATRANLAATSPLLQEAGRLTASLDRALPPAPGALRRTAVVLHDSHRPLARAVPLLNAIMSATPATVALMDNLPPVLTMLDDTMGSAKPLVAKLGAIGCDVHRWATNWSSMLNVGVTVPRGAPELGPATSLRLTAGATPDQGAKALTANGIHIVGSNPFPKPCEAGTEKLP